jgi:hypothetical protein
VIPVPDTQISRFHVFNPWDRIKEIKETKEKDSLPEGYKYLHKRRPTCYAKFAATADGHHIGPAAQRLGTLCSRCAWPMAKAT